MLVLFFKSANALRRDDQSDNEPVDDKMRRILESHVEEAEPGEERARAENALREFAQVST
jgi:hypothetical protein